MKIEGAGTFGFQISLYEDMDSDRDRYPRKILKGDRFGLEWRFYIDHLGSTRVFFLEVSFCSLRILCMYTSDLLGDVTQESDTSVGSTHRPSCDPSPLLVERSLLVQPHGPNLSPIRTTPPVGFEIKGVSDSWFCMAYISMMINPIGSKIAAPPI